MINPRMEETTVTATTPEKEPEFDPEAAEREPFYSDNPAFDHPEATNNLNDKDYEGVEPDSSGPAQEGGLNPTSVPGVDSFDPSEKSVAEVQEYLEQHPEQEEAILAKEREGKNRTTLTGE